MDTLFDLPMIREILSAMRPFTDRTPITDALITHSNGDHTHGNQLLDPSVRIIAAAGTAEEIVHGMAPEMLAMAQTANLGPSRLLTRETGSGTSISAASRCATPT